MEAGIIIRVDIHVVWFNAVAALVFNHVHSFSHNTFHIAWPVRTHLDQLMRLWYLSHRRPAKSRVWHLCGYSSLYLGEHNEARRQAEAEKYHWGAREREREQTKNDDFRTFFFFFFFCVCVCVCVCLFNQCLKRGVCDKYRLHIDKLLHMYSSANRPCRRRQLYYSYLTGRAPEISSLEVDEQVILC